MYFFNSKRDPLIAFDYNSSYFSYLYGILDLPLISPKLRSEFFSFPARSIKVSHPDYLIFLWRFYISTYIETTRWDLLEDLFPLVSDVFLCEREEKIYLSKCSKELIFSIFVVLLYILRNFFYILPSFISYTLFLWIWITFKPTKKMNYF